MASETTNYKLIKPAPEEFYDVEVQNSNMDKIDTALKELEDNKASSTDLMQLQQEFMSHLADYVKHPAYAVASGSANNYSITLNPAPTSYVEGMAIAVKINVDNTGLSTINVNGLGAKAIKKPNGNDVSAGNLKAGSIYTLRYNGTNFILQGEGGSGNAQPGDVLSGKTFTNDSGEQVGTMPNRGAMTITPTTTDKVIPAGYHNGSGKVKGDANLIHANIKQGVNIFGVVGTLIERKFQIGVATSAGTATQYELDAGYSASRYSVSVTGLTFMPSIIILLFKNGTQHMVDYLSSSQLPDTANSDARIVSGLQAFRLVSPASVTSSGFTLPCNAPNTTVYWYAFG